MTIFLNILFILVIINAVLLVFSVNRNTSKEKKTAEQPSAKVYPLNIITTKYKKAI
ncbi:hypothetical protein SAMN05660313_03142 [Cellulophaga fucicola]|uniref:Uncharacterized protein n=1 Tax=Cellulophaga fucicola TaxID=76595 RepID=A0A1K1R0U1_9FLAO|nr:hypothetical protein SAMN05660313_03142 [Cellulophaga fucicola]